MARTLTGRAVRRRVRGIVFRWRLIFRTVRENLILAVAGVVSLLGAAGLWWIDRRHGIDGHAPLWLAVPLAIFGGVMLLLVLLAAPDAADFHAALPARRRVPTPDEVSELRRKIDRALAAAERAAREDAGGFDYAELAARLRRDHAGAEEFLRESISPGYVRWLSGELELERRGPAAAGLVASLRELEDCHRNFARPPGV